MKQSSYNIFVLNEMDLLRTKINIKRGGFMKIMLFCDSKSCDCLKNYENTPANLHLCKSCEHYNEVAEMASTRESWYEHEKDELEHTAW